MFFSYEVMRNMCFYLDFLEWTSTQKCLKNERNRSWWIRACHVTLSNDAIQCNVMKFALFYTTIIKFLWCRTERHCTTLHCISHHVAHSYLSATTFRIFHDTYKNIVLTIEISFHNIYILKYLNCSRQTEINICHYHSHTKNNQYGVGILTTSSTFEHAARSTHQTTSSF